MSKKRPSEKAESLDFGPYGPRNLKQVYQFIDLSPTVAQKLRYDGLGALLMTARIHETISGQPPLEVLAGLSTGAHFLREALRASHARRKGYSNGAIKNWRSLVVRCAAESGVKLRTGRRRVRLPDTWQELFDQLDPRGQMVLYPFMRWAVEEGLSPELITQAIMERYRAYLEGCVLRSDVRRTLTQVNRQWRLAQSRVPDWPQQPVELISIRDFYILPWTAFGDEFHLEVQRMMAVAGSPDVTVRGRRKRLNTVTVKHQTYQLRRIASALVRATGCDPKNMTTVKQLVDPTAARDALRFLAVRSHARQRARRQQDIMSKQSTMTGEVDDGQVFIGTMDLHLLAALLRTVGGWWCKLPNKQLEQLAGLRDELKPPLELCGMTPGNREMLNHFDDHTLADRLLTLPLHVLEKFENRSGFSAADRIRIRRATMIGVQCATAMRPKNLASLELGRHVFERGDRIHIHLPASEVKNRLPMEYILPARTAQQLRFYIKKVRPLLLPGDSAYLWPSPNGGHLGAGHIGTDLGDFTEAELGVRVTGHRFRHVLGYLYLLKNPSGHEIVRLLLGHRKITTTQTYYASLTARHGHQIFDAFVTERLDTMGFEDPSKPRGGRRG